jgi:GxxExxY protein
MKRPISKDVLFPELSYQIMQAAFEVHNQLGPGFLEAIYESALIVELTEQQIPFEQQKEVKVNYKESHIGTHHLDIVVDNKIILELKAISELADIHKQQLLSYLKATNLQLGILINFGTKRVQSFRIVN